MKLIAIAVLAALAGCAAPPPLKTVSTFNKGEAEALLKKGTGTIKGSAVIRQQGGGTVTCAGAEVELAPATQYATERMLNIYRSDTRGYRAALGYQQHETTDPDYLTTVRKTTCDAQGYFRFSEVGVGAFYVVTSVLWQTNPYYLSGGVLMQRVDLKAGESVEIVLSP